MFADDFVGVTTRTYKHRLIKLLATVLIIPLLKNIICN